MDSSSTPVQAMLELVQDLFPTSLVFVQFLCLLAPIVAIRVLYNYYRRYKIAKRRAAATSDATFNFQLPPELIEEILRYLDTPSLLAAAQVNRCWCEYAGRKSIRDPLFERESVQPLSLDEVRKVMDVNVRDSHVELIDASDSPLFLKQWLVEDNILAKRLNKRIISATLRTSHYFSYDETDPKQKYLLKTRLKWISEDKEFVTFASNNTHIHIAKKLIVNVANIGEEYEIITGLDISDGICHTDLKIHRFRVTQVMNPLKGVQMILMMVYVPILLKDIISILRSDRFIWSHYLVLLAGVLMNIYLDGLFFYDTYLLIRMQRNRIRSIRKVWSAATIFVKIYIWIVWNYFALWCNNGLCWIIGMGIFKYINYSKAIFWAKRHQIGFKTTAATLALSVLLFIYAADWSLLFTYIITGRIWRTLLTNMAYSLATMALINFEKVINESLYALRWSYSCLNTPLKEWIHGILAQVLVVVVFSIYAPAGFINLLKFSE